MKILMIGLGSIGQRHLRNIKAHFGNRAEILAYRVRGLQTTFSDTMQIRENCILEDEFQIRAYSNLNKALKQEPQVAYITNITKAHIPCAIQALRAGCHVFLEKPISDSMEGIGELLKEVHKSNRIVFVGFQNRYHPCLMRMKEMVDSELLGKILSVQSEVGERLTTMHTYEDYRETYMARKDQGGGVIMNQQIHELDYLQWIFGMPSRVVSFNGKNSTLPIDVEDCCDSIYWIEQPTGGFPIYAHADFFQYPPKRFCKLICQNGWAVADLLSATFAYTLGDDVHTEKFPDFQRNQMFIAEMKDFFDCVDGAEQKHLTLDDGIVSLRMACAAKQSAKENRIIDLSEVRV